MKKETNKSKDGVGAGVIVGVGIAALAAAAAGTYFLYGSKKALRNRKIVKGWMLQAKGEIVEKLETVKDVNEDAYNRIIQEVTDRYEKLKNIDLQEMKVFRDELKKHWVNIKKDIQAPVRSKSRSKTAGKGKSRPAKK
jgi:3-hydroxyacyl-CoA dehydrogenase